MVKPKKKTSMKPNELLNGKQFHFINTKHQESIGGDDIRGGTAFFSKRIDCFCIWFNGGLIHCTKTFPPMKKRLVKLITDWHLEETEEEQM